MSSWPYLLKLSVFALQINAQPTRGMALHRPVSALHPRQIIAPTERRTEPNQSASPVGRRRPLGLNKWRHNERPLAGRFPRHPGLT